MDPRPSFPRLTGTADVSVRPAVPADAADVARVQGTTWQAAFRGVLPDAVLDEWDAAAAAAAWTAAVTAPPTPAHGVLVALDGAQVVGFAAYGPPELGAGEEPHPEGPSTELAVLLVEPRWGRRGHGSRLLAAVADLAAGTGAARLQAWVAERDAVTAAFLESAGWARDGWARTLDAAGTPLREVRWHALLGGDA
ncbi:GNAT superfamily N-acetyltransferase [Geodermatophilus bullaregiensis]|uniref:GNAT family N-acetyltransferase n=1 Tax=Geodermatophilus bullaregiensis TaxID=1564160 RepID=UPI0019584040|nr:GNAT family N-acetyltransferase [Geodermatophilus bullaregiensis]MBM7805427.1 GNAT superfamily N-acetyltransferase [Geodermatophilus bullaregiensis]